MEETTTPKQKKRAKLPKLSKQDLAFVDKVVETGKLTRSAQEAYELDNQRYATQKALRQIAKDSIIEAIEVKRKSLRQALIDKGIDEDYLASKVDVLLNATDGEKPDYTAIDKGLKHAETWFGVEDPDKPKGNTTYNFILNQSFKDKIKPLEDELKTQFRNARPIEEL